MQQRLEEAREGSLVFGSPSPKEEACNNKFVVPWIVVSWVQGVEVRVREFREKPTYSPIFAALLARACG